MKKVNKSSNRTRQSNSDSRKDTRSKRPRYTRRAYATADTEDPRISRNLRREFTARFKVSLRKLEASFRLELRKSVQADERTDEVETGEDELGDHSDLDIPAFTPREQTI